MMETTDNLDLRPRLAPHYCFRWEESQNAYILLYPEGLIKLNDTAGEIMKRCDGQSSVLGIINDLRKDFPDADADIADGVQAFINVARTKGWLRP